MPQRAVQSQDAAEALKLDKALNQLYCLLNFKFLVTAERQGPPLKCLFY